MNNHPSKEFMEAAMKEATLTDRKHTPMGAVIIDTTGKIVASAHNMTRENNDATAHAEIGAIRLAGKNLGNRYLNGCWMYSTMEPCAMCISAAVWAKLEGVVFGATKEDAIEHMNETKNTTSSAHQLNISARDIVSKLNPPIQLIEKFMQDECKKLFKLEEI